MRKRDVLVKKGRCEGCSKETMWSRGVGRRVSVRV